MTLRVSEGARDCSQSRELIRNGSCFLYVFMFMSNSWTNGQCKEIFLLKCCVLF